MAVLLHCSTAVVLALMYIHRVFSVVMKYRASEGQLCRSVVFEAQTAWYTAEVTYCFSTHTVSWMLLRSYLEYTVNVHTLYLAVSVHICGLLEIFLVLPLTLLSSSSLRQIAIND